MSFRLTTISSVTDAVQSSMSLTASKRRRYRLLSGAA
jgi:hypothetical protein